MTQFPFGAFLHGLVLFLALIVLAVLAIWSGESCLRPLLATHLAEFPINEQQPLSAKADAPQRRRPDTKPCRSFGTTTTRRAGRSGMTVLYLARSPGV